MRTWSRVAISRDRLTQKPANKPQLRPRSETTTSHLDASNVVSQCGMAHHRFHIASAFGAKANFLAMTLQLQRSAISKQRTNPCFVHPRLLPEDFEFGVRDIEATSQTAPLGFLEARDFAIHGSLDVPQGLHLLFPVHQLHSEHPNTSWAIPSSSSDPRLLPLQHQRRPDAK